MNDLTPEAARLVRAGRRALRPSSADRDRNLEALQVRLGASAFHDPVGHHGLSLSGAISRDPARWPWPAISAVTVGVAVVAGTLFFGLGPSEAPGEPPQAGAATSAKPVGTATEPAKTEGVSTSPPEADGTEGPKNAPSEPSNNPARRRRERLAEEVAILSRATSSLRAGRAQDALRALEEHQSKFPSGLLAEERRAARAQALCTLGRRSEAQVELDRLARTSPQSVQANRARQVCSGER